MANVALVFAALLSKARIRNSTVHEGGSILNAMHRPIC
jgi:hypothetical protein